MYREPGASGNHAFVTCALNLGEALWAAPASASMTALRIRTRAMGPPWSTHPLGFPAMEVEERAEEAPEGAHQRDLSGVSRYYELAKRAEWQVKDLPWGEIAPIPEYKGSPQKLARRQDLWRSVITQQLQADELAVEMATQLFAIAPDHEAKLYYTTMVQDESRHTEAWLRLVEEAGGRGEQDPYLNQLAELQLEFESIEEKV